MRIAIIPARGGSKRLPRKNLRPFHGKPIIHYAIAAAKASKLFDDVLVSTDDPEIATAAHMAGCQRVLKRPPELADDHATTGDVMTHALRQLIEEGHPLTHACCIYPCTPMITPLDLQRGYDALLASGMNYAFPVVQYAPPVQRMLKIVDAHGLLEPVWPQFEPVRTQDLEPRFHDAGQWYWGTIEAWVTGRPVHGGGRSIGLPIERLRAIDIDTMDDWVIAEAIYQREEYIWEGKRLEQLADHVAAGGKLTSTP